MDEVFENICKDRLSRKWNALSPTGVQTIMRDEWELGIKPQFKMQNIQGKEFIVRVPAEAFRGGDTNDVSRRPYIKNGRIHFSRYVRNYAFVEKAFSLCADDLADVYLSVVTSREVLPR